MRFVLPVLTLAAAAIAVTPVSAATRDWPARGFDQVDLQAVADVSVRQGPGFSVHAEGDPDMLARLRITVDHGRLVIGWTHEHISLRREHHLRIAVTMPQIAGVALGGAGNITVDPVRSPAFTADLGGAGNIRVNGLRADRVRLNVGGTGEISVSGAARVVDERVSGVGSIEAGGLAARGGRVSMSGAGHVRTRIDGPVDVTLSGLGSVAIDGHPTCSIHKSGLGSVRCG